MRRNNDDRDPPRGRASLRLAQFEGARQPPSEPTPTPSEAAEPEPESNSDEDCDGAEEQEGS